MKRALVVDDSKEIIDLLRMALDMKGIYVETAMDGDEGIRKYDGGDFDLVITDLNMPKYDGNEVCEHIRKSNTPNTPVIGMSGTPKAFGDFFDAVMHKPFTLKTLFEHVQFLLAAEEEQNNFAVYG
mgnify:CR=1 FL=1